MEMVVQPLPGRVLSLKPLSADGGSQRLLVSCFQSSVLCEDSCALSGSQDYPGKNQFLNKVKSMKESHV